MSQRVLVLALLPALHALMLILQRCTMTNRLDRPQTLLVAARNAFKAYQ